MDRRELGSKEHKTELVNDKKLFQENGHASGGAKPTTLNFILYIK